MFKLMRNSDIDMLGPGICLYMKLLKYYAVVFVILTGLSLPAILIFFSGSGFKAESLEFNAIFASTSMGNLAQFKDLVFTEALLTQESNMTAVFDFKCRLEEQAITGLAHFGMTFQDEQTKGTGIDTTIKTIDTCTYGQLNPIQGEFELEQQFYSQCDQLNECQLSVDLKRVFNDDCLYRMQRRLNGFTYYGEASVKALVVCSQEELNVIGLGQMSRDMASAIIVGLDLLIQFVFVVALFRVKYLEELTNHDMKQGVYSLDDFSILIENVPIPPSDYENNPELLAAMIVPHLEEVVRNEVQVISELEGEAHESEIIAIHFGRTTQNIIKYLVQIYECAQEISLLRQKIKNDPLNIAEYERREWKLYTRITSLKDTYYHEKVEITPRLRNAYVTFRSMEGKQRALQAYYPSRFHRIFTEVFCNMSQMFKKKKLNMKGFYKLGEAFQPENIIWENIGVPLNSKLWRWGTGIVFSGAFLALNFFVLQKLASFEKLKNVYMKNECETIDSEISMFAAMDDRELAPDNQVGILNCYCKQVYDAYGSVALKIMFPDGEKHCAGWYQVYQFQFLQLFVLAFYLALMNTLLQHAFHAICTWLGRPKNKAVGYNNTISIIFAAQYLNTVVMLLLAFMSLRYTREEIEKNDPEQMLVGPFDEFSLRWYMIVGAPLILSAVLQIFSPHLGVMLLYGFVRYQRYKDRGFTED
mmetsp:Transcript_1146/g.2100  ORF Transcript_1146/g.2100 Transcript_1146/m.2100 type:complete len:700 (+) Transcript_1146:1456-3555(+)